MATPRKPNPSAGVSEEILYEILLRLPVKTLLQYKTICKSWLSLISSSHFVKTHLSISTNDTQFTHHYLLPKHQKQDYLESYSVYSMLNKPVTEAIKIDSPIKNDSQDLAEVVGCCNGLVCLKIGKPMHVFFWNPCTRKIRRLPELINTELELVNFGFGYDEFSDDFKLFVIAGYHGYEKKVSVYSSKSNSWKRIGDFLLTLHWEMGCSQMELYTGLLEKRILWKAKLLSLSM